MRTFLVSFFASLVIAFGTDFGYTEWLENQTAIDFGEMVPLSQTTKIETLSAPSGKKLVPTGAILGTNDVDIVCYTYSVSVQAGNSLDVSISDVTLTKAQETPLEAEGIFTFSFEVEMQDSTQAIVTVWVRLNRPVSQEAYEKLQGCTASFQIHFDQKP